MHVTKAIRLARNPEILSWPTAENVFQTLAWERKLTAARQSNGNIRRLIDVCNQGRAGLRTFVSTAEERSRLRPIRK